MSQSQTAPMWYCHECANEIRPLMTPDPQCPRCRGSFVEKIEDPNDDPRNFQRQEGGPDNFNPFAFLTGINDILATQGPPPNERRGSEPSSTPRSGDRPTSPHSGGLRFEFTTSGPGGRRSFVFGGNNTLDRETPDGGRTPNLSDFLHANSVASGAAAPREPQIPGQLMIQYLMNMMGEAGGPGGHGLHPFMGMDAGGVNQGRWGDYVFSQNALDQLMTQLMEGANSNRPVPATDEIMNNLPRVELAEGNHLLEKDCAVCKEQFSTAVEDPSEKKVVTLPCKHPFHEGCIIPWLKSSGTCPICRHQLIPQPGSHNPGERPQPAGNNRPSSPEDDRRRSTSMPMPMPVPVPGGANTTDSRPPSTRQTTGDPRPHVNPGGENGAGGRRRQQFFFTNLGTPPPGGQQNAGPGTLFNMLFGRLPRGHQQPQPQPPQPGTGNANGSQGGAPPNNADPNSSSRPNDRSPGGESEHPPGGWNRWYDELD